MEVINALGRRKTAVARVYLKEGSGVIKINNRDQNFPSRGSLNIGAARRDLDYNPKTNIEEGFENYYRWLCNSVYWSEKTV